MVVEIHDYSREFEDDPIEIGESIAVNGCCLTVVSAKPSALPEISPLPGVGEELTQRIVDLSSTLSNVAIEIGFELSEETLIRTSFSQLSTALEKQICLVNIERAMKVGDRFGGHIVQGHVDGTGSLLSVQGTDQAHVMLFSYPAEMAKYVIDKGSITVDGISLTAVGPTDSEFEVWIIPHTWANTNLSLMKVNQKVNLEFDMIAKYLERLTGPS